MGHGAELVASRHDCAACLLWLKFIIAEFYGKALDIGGAKPYDNGKLNGAIITWIIPDSKA
jgi:hypothetical protein